MISCFFLGATSYGNLIPKWKSLLIKDDIISLYWNNPTNIKPAEFKDLEAPPTLINASNILNTALVKIKFELSGKNW